MMHASQTASAILCTLCLALWPTASIAAGPSESAEAQESAAAEKDDAQQAGGTEAGPALEALRRRVERIESELKRLRSDPPANGGDVNVLTLIETPHWGSVYYSTPEGERFFAARLIIVNRTPSPITIDRDQIRLAVDGTVHKMTELPRNLKSASFQVDNQSYQLKNLQPSERLNIPAGQNGTTWVVFADLPPGNHVPKLELTIDVDDQMHRIDVNEYALGLLGLEVERIGPRGSLGLLTISGTMNTISAGSLVSALDQLAAQKVARAVIRWSDSAPPVDTQLLAWLKRAVTETGRDEPANSPLPTIPVAIRELHLSGLPGSDSAQETRSDDPMRRIHDSDVDAVDGALKTAFQVLPRDELLQEIERGHPLSRAAALTAGGGRLPPEQLPLLLEYADHNDPALQRAALFALRHFGEPPVIEKLLYYVRNNTEPLATTAIESLAASRYSAAHQALLSVLQNEDPGSKQHIVRILARYPRPVWSDTVFEFVKDSDPEVCVAALRALATIGHPDLVDVLSEAIQSGHDAMREQAFLILVSRTDPPSEELASRYAIEQLKSAPPNDAMYKLLRRTKDPRAVPLLLEHLNDSKQNRTQLINLLSHIGDQSVAHVLAENYADMPSNEKAAVLTALERLKSPAFCELAGRALLSTDNSLISTAAQGLRNDGSPKAVRLLIEALRSSNNTATWSYTTNALGVLGTPEAQAALQEARDADDKHKRRYALNALQMLRQRSPGYQYVYHAQRSMQEKKWADAVTKYSLALKLDPQLSDAYAGRANALLNLNKHKEAREDFAKAYELDPYNSTAATGLAVVLVMDGKAEDGIRLVEDVREKFANDQLFAYNTACVYGQALAHLQKDEQPDNHSAKIKDYQAKALSDLKRSVNLGFRNFEWMRQDPDLNSLHGLPEFQEIHTNDPGENTGDGDEESPFSDDDEG